MKDKKTILVTGSSGNLGGEVVSFFQDAGWQVVGFDIEAPSGSGPDYYFHCDVTDEDAVKSEVDRIEKDVCKLDALFTAAGTEVSEGFEETAIEEWRDLLNVWLGGTTNVCRAVAPYMVERKQGKMMLLSPDYKEAGEDCVMNAAAAGTIHGFAKSFGTEVAPENVTVNAISPSLPFDREAIAAMVYYLADKDAYTSAQVVSVTGEKGGVPK